MKINILPVVVLLLFTGSSFKMESGNRNEAIQNALRDFLNTPKLYKKDSVFSVSYSDTVYRMALNKIDDRNSKWVRGEIYDRMVAVSIIASRDQFLITAKTKVGSKSNLPSRFIEKEGRLFYWWDNDHPLTEETLTVFNKYKLLQDDQGGKLPIADFTINDAQKGAQYYFCRDDLSKYKRVITNKGMGYYDPPKLKCGH